MFHNPIVKDNIKKLKRFGCEIIEPAYGMLANGVQWDGRMSDEEVLLAYILNEILAYLGEHKREGQFICGFSMGTGNVLENSRKKLAK